MYYMGRRTMTAQNLIDASNGSEIRFTEYSGTFAKVRTVKDNYGNAIGALVVDTDGNEFRVSDHNGDTVIAETPAVAAVPEPVGLSVVMTEADWFDYEVGGYNITA